MTYQKFVGAVLAIALTGAVAYGVESAYAAEYVIVKDGIPKSLTGKAGDAAKGRKTAISRKKGNCLACHVIPDAADQPFHGEIGPPLGGIGGRLSAAEIRLRIVDPKVLNPGTIMPAFFRKDGFSRVAKKFKGKSMLSAAEVEDIIAYMQTLN